MQFDVSPFANDTLVSGMVVVHAAFFSPPSPIIVLCRVTH